VAQGQHLKAILQQIKDNSAQLRKVRYGRHIVSYVEKMLDEQGHKKDENHHYNHYNKNNFKDYRKK